MGTAEKLLTINETDFETLVVLYLRQRSPDLQGLIHTGMNEDGKSIKCPVDAVLHVIGPPSKLVHVAATVHKPTEIQRKWLGGKKTKGKPEPGDIAKAHEEFAAWSTEPETKRKLYLGWNRTLENDTQLYRDVKARCQSLDMEVEVIEASQLVDFLDHDPEGQYLRQEFLGIDALRLSQSLLRKIAISSLRYDCRRYMHVCEDATSTTARRLDCSDVDLFHLHHRIERALGGSAVGIFYCFGQGDRKEIIFRLR